MRSYHWRVVIFILLLGPIAMVRADQIELQNGDHISGAVLSMTADTVVLQNEVLGQLKVPRNKISTIALGSAANASRPSASTNKLAQARTAAGGVADAETAGALSELGAHTNLIQQIQKQFLGDAGPQANDKFNDLLNGLLTGKMDISGLRAEAKSAADQIRAMKKDSGGEANDMLDAYLGVLENFLADSSK